MRAPIAYAPGIKTPEQISAVVKAVHPKPVNLLIGASGLSVAEAGQLGVRRISVGGSLARTAWAGFMRAAGEIADNGTFTELASGYPGVELNKMFG
jgi:2-methylisocitrate lyase-like PEP mutase family enzyme